MKRKWMIRIPWRQFRYEKFWLTVRLCWLLLLVFILPSFGAAFSQHQKMDIHVKNVTLEELIKKIKENASVDFLYNLTEIEKGGTVSVEMEQATVEEILQVALKGKGLGYSLSNGVIVIRPQAGGPQEVQTVKGKVIDVNGDALPGVSVVIKGTTIGVSTDIHGNFSLSLPDFKGKTLVFSFIGMTSQEVPVKDYKTLIKVTLEESVQMLQETVITGIYSRNKESFTGSASTYSAKDLKMVGRQNVIQSLKILDPALTVFESKLNGSNPNRMPDMEIRGKTSIVGLKTDYETDPNRPLFILDGMESTLEAIMDLNMDRVASVTILKDAASAAIYGSKSANGVIVVETVQPQAGQLRLSYNGSYGVQFADLSDYNLMNAAEKLEFERLSNRYNGFGDYSTQVSKDNIYFKRLADILRGVDTYWMNEPLRTVFNHRHSLYADGGDEAMRYGLGVTYDDKAGIMKGSERKVMSGNINLRYRKGKLLFSNSFTFSMTNTENEPVSFQEFAQANPYYRKENPDGSIPLYLEYIKDGAIGGNIEILNPLYKWQIKNINEGRSISINDNFSVEWNPFSSLKLNARLGINKAYNKTIQFKSPKHPDFIGADPIKQGTYSHELSEPFNYSVDLGINFGKLFKDAHLVSLIGGMHLAESSSVSNGYSIAGFTSDDHLNPAFSSGFTDKQKPSFSESLTRDASFFVNGNYSYKNRYLMDFNIRLDGTSVFGSNKRFATTWAVGLAWNLHNENFIKELGWVDNFKIRATVGNPGNRNFNAYIAMKTYSYNSNLTNMFGTSAIISGFGNKNLKWQRTINKTIGIDLAILKGNLRFTMDYYHKVTDPMLTNIAMPPSLGTTQINSNLGGLLATGFDGRISYTFLRRKELNWSANFSASRSKQKYQHIGKSLEYLNTLGSSTQLNRYYEGADPDDMYAVKSLGIDPATGREVFLKKDGTQTFKWSASDEVVVGNRRPDLRGNFGTTFFYKGFSVSCFFGYTLGAQVEATALLNKVENIGEDQLYYNQDKRALYDRWKKPGDVAKFKSIENQDKTSMSSRFIKTENTLAGQSISASYESSAKWVHYIGAQGINFDVNMNDLFRISSFKEERGIDYPFSRQILFTVGLRF